MTKKITVNRRQTLKGIALGAGVTASSTLLNGCQTAQFQQGVASGDPLHDRVILWTRITVAQAVQSVAVSWQIAKDQQFETIISSGDVETNARNDFTVKVDAQGLQAGTQYYYRFYALGCRSPVGQTRTLPQGAIDSVRFAVVSCASYPHGYFNVYREITHHDIDLVLHLGDYIYEYGPGEYDDQDEVAEKRMVNPPRELLTLNDYRLRYQQYRSDPDLKDLHALRPFICVWDDHEVANDAWRAGAQNHNQGEGDFFERRRQALQAYYEWMPIREPSSVLDVYRQFEFGDLLTLYMLDTRHGGRDQQLNHMEYITNLFLSYDYQTAEAEIRDAQRTLLGDEQKSWLKAALSRSTSTWQVFGQQVLMARMEVPWRLAAVFEAGVDIFTGENLEELFDPNAFPADISHIGPRFVGYNLDAWDGYYAEREELLAHIKDNNLNMINLAGDTHNAWASNLTTADDEIVGVEFATASVASPGISDFLQGVPFLSELFTGVIADLKYADVYSRGFLILDINHQQAEAEWVYVNTVKSKLYFKNFFVGKKLKVLPGEQGRKIEQI